MLAALALTASVLVGCDRSVDVQRDGDTTIVTITLTEADIQDSLTDALANRSDLRIQNAQIDLQPGLIVIAGDFTTQDGKSGSGSVSFAPAVSNGELTLTVTDLTVSGFSADDEALAAMTQRLQDAINARASSRTNRSRADVALSSVTISDDNMQIVFTITR
jgi:molybdopterin-biosynthesis enzyme MoeA-like protein